MTHEILKPSFVRNDERGLFVEVLNGSAWESLIMGSMNPGAVLGNHYHKQTLVFFYVVQGSVSVKTLHVDTGARDQFQLGDQQGVVLHTNESHAIHFLAPTQFIMMKSLRYDPANPDTYELRVD
jgi:dTDP-4-dehydrorhamnose 3,5-epimerase-like enzyme